MRTRVATAPPIAIRAAVAGRARVDAEQRGLAAIDLHGQPVGLGLGAGLDVDRAGISRMNAASLSAAVPITSSGPERV